MDYLSNQASLPNGASAFSPVSTVSVDGVAYNLTVVTEAAAAGGSAKETIESIRQNAPIAFTSQRRLVTAEDYRLKSTLILVDS